MDQAADILERALKAREFTHTHSECVFTLRTPTRHEVHQVTHELGLRDLTIPAQFSLLEYELVTRCLVAWTGVRVRDLLLPDPDRVDDMAPVPCTRTTIAMYLDANPTEGDTMAAALMSRVRLRNERLEGDAKNSSRTLSAPETPTRCEPPPSSSA